MIKTSSKSIKLQLFIRKCVKEYLLVDYFKYSFLYYLFYAKKYKFVLMAHVLLKTEIWQNQIAYSILWIRIIKGSIISVNVYPNTIFSADKALFARSLFKT